MLSIFPVAKLTYQEGERTPESLRDQTYFHSKRYTRPQDDYAADLRLLHEG